MSSQDPNKSAFWHMSRMMDRILDEYMKEMRRTSNQPIADHSVLQAANIAHQVDDDKKFAVSMDVSQFKPEELKVNLDGRMLTVEGKQESKGENTFMARSFVRSWYLPEDIDVDRLKTDLSDKGKLTIEAPKIPNTSKRNIPIQQQSQSTRSQSRSHSQKRSRSESKSEH
ncbi:Hsp20/alpha crystallin family protein [Cooperia oncophora]